MIMLNIFGMVGPLSLAYTWNKDERNPLAWPYFATVGGRGSLPSPNLVVGKGATIVHEYDCTRERFDGTRVHDCGRTRGARWTT
jgi:hypothetical protein